MSLFTLDLAIPWPTPLYGSTRCLAGWRRAFRHQRKTTPSSGWSLMEQLIKHPQATFLLRVRGESVKDAGIFDNDVVLVDRAINRAQAMWSLPWSTANSFARSYGGGQDA